MLDPEPIPTTERAEPTGSWRPASFDGPTPASDSSPTVRTGSGSSGSKSRRKEDPLPMPRTGDRLESFELHEAIGVGGMGAVFLASDTRLHRQVALKILPPEQSNDLEVVQRFYQEGRAAAQLDHENIARVYTIGNDRGYHYIAFEYIEGTTIRQRVEEHGPLSVEETINYTLQIAGALVHASERGVVHRDIKPSNIIVTPQGRAKLVDMGLARRFERGVSDDGLTQSGMTLGTFDYISPEQARDPRDVDVRSDLYSLGCTMFHMLTGRPPFPEGTVLQKLLQHQEEPAPDVRTINPAVPADLAAIILKLMAKDRDRRYQKPEQLVRDLLTIAGTLGLRSISPEGLVWMSSKPPATWERHLVWLLPAAGLGVVLAALVWWGQPSDVASPPLSPEPDTPSLNQSALANSTAPPKITIGPSTTEAAPKEPEPDGSTAREPSVWPAREILVGSDDELETILSQAASGSRLVLTDDGPYDLRPTAIPRANASSNAATSPPRTLTIQAGADVRPVLRLDRGSSRETAEAALLVFQNSRITLEGLEFQIDMSERDGSLAAVFAENTDLSLKRCWFRRSGSRIGQARSTALHLRSENRRARDGESEPPEAVRVDACYFDGGQVGILAQGPTDVQLRDCTFGPAEPAVWFDNAESRSPIPARLLLRHVSILAGPTAVFRFSRTEGRVDIDDSVIAPPNQERATLVTTDEPSRLEWHGRDNLYGRIATYLQPTSDLTGGSPILTFSEWADDPQGFREARSAATEEHVWEQNHPQQSLTQRDPTVAFQLGAIEPPTPEPGARRGPRGPIARPAGFLASLIGSALSKRSNARTLVEADAKAGPPKPALETELPPRAPATRPPTTSEPMPIAVDEPDAPRVPPSVVADVGAPSEPMRREPMPMPMPVVDRNSSETVGATEPESPMERSPMVRGEFDREPPEESVPRERLSTDERTAESSSPALELPRTSANPVKNGGSNRPGEGTSTSNTPRGPSNSTDGAIERDLIRTPEQFQRALLQLGARGGTLRLASDADLVLPSCEIPESGRWMVTAASGVTRPRLRFRPSASDLRSPERPALFRVLPRGSLELQGVDLILERAEAPSGGRWSAIALGAGANLALDRCTVTIETDLAESSRPRSSLIAVVSELGPEAVGLDSSASSIRVTESLLRTGGDVVDVAAGRRLDHLELTNVVVASGASLLHGHGVPRDQTPEPLKMVLRQVTARVAGGLVRLESAPGEPELPLAEVVARDSILATTPQGDPLCRVEGQDSLNSLRDRIAWESHSVVYHQIDTYRRDQSALSGTVPDNFKRSSWDVAVGPREDAAIHGDVRFLKPWNTDRAYWTLTRDDMRLAPDSPAPLVAGPDLSRIPEAPELDEF